MSPRSPDTDLSPPDSRRIRRVALSRSACGNGAAAAAGDGAGRPGPCSALPRGDRGRQERSRRFWAPNGGWACHRGHSLDQWICGHLRLLIGRAWVSNPGFRSGAPRGCPTTPVCVPPTPHSPSTPLSKVVPEVEAGSLLPVWMGHRGRRWRMPVPGWGTCLLSPGAAEGRSRPRARSGRCWSSLSRPPCSGAGLKTSKQAHKKRGASWPPAPASSHPRRRPVSKSSLAWCERRVPSVHSPPAAWAP